MNKIFLSFFYIGFAPYAPGTFGSLAGIILGLLIQSFFGFFGLLATITLLFLLGWKATKNYVSQNSENHDPQEIVVDEVVGQLVSYLPISFHIYFFKSEGFISTFYDWMIAFLLFRFFDIFKPWPVNWADKMNSALGVMLDDLTAGLYCAIVFSSLLLIY